MWTWMGHDRTIGKAAKNLSREAKIPPQAALDCVAKQEAFKGWSLPTSKAPQMASAEELLARLVPGDTVLVGARPGQGKTLLSLGLVFFG